MHTRRGSGAASDTDWAWVRCHAAVRGPVEPASSASDSSREGAPARRHFSLLRTRTITRFCSWFATIGLRAAIRLSENPPVRRDATVASLAVGLQKGLHLGKSQIVSVGLRQCAPRPGEAVMLARNPFATTRISGRKFCDNPKARLHYLGSAVVLGAPRPFAALAAARRCPPSAALSHHFRASP